MVDGAPTDDFDYGEEEEEDDMPPMKKKKGDKGKKGKKQPGEGFASYEDFAELLDKGIRDDEEAKRRTDFITQGAEKRSFQDRQRGRGGGRGGRGRGGSRGRGGGAFKRQRK